MSRIVEQTIEDAAIEILERELGYGYIHGAEIAPDAEPAKKERERWDDVVLVGRLKRSLGKINPGIPAEAIDDAIKQVLRFRSKEIVMNNEKFHKLLSEGFPIQYRTKEGIKDDILWLVDFDNPEENEFLVVNQFAIIEGEKHRRPDMVIFVNGIPLALIELKNPFAAEENKMDSAFKQIQTYKQEIPSIFNYNEVLVCSDGTFADAGTITGTKEWFLPWKTIRGEHPSKNKALPQLQVMLEGMFRKEIFLDLIKHFITFNESKKGTDKVIAGYHQYHAANKAVKNTLSAIKKDGRIGVLWHTQGSGKSLTMTFYASKIAVQPDLNNPTLVVLTDRNDLDDQLFQTFSSTSVLRETPIQVKSKEELRNELKKRASGGIIFATIQKFGLDKDNKVGLLSDRKNIIVAADEAHRSQYGFSAKIAKGDGELRYGLAKYLRDALPNACFIGFTGTPIDFKDKSTRAVFGDYLDVYDIARAVEDERTVRIYYEPKLIKVGLDKKELDKEVEDLLKEGYPDETDEAIYQKQKVKSKWARVESIIGSEKRINALAKEVVNHFEARQEVMEGKAMIVCMSRRICVELYNKIAKLRPAWINKEDKKGLMKVIMTGSAEDGPEWQEHIRNKERRRVMGDSFKDPNSEFKLAIVRDMWLTGFDAPCLNTLYVDKPMKGHGLMQAIARVNRVYKEKEGGLIVDFIGIGSELKLALKDYSSSGGKGKPAYEKEEAIALMLEKYDIVRSILHGFDYMNFFKDGPKKRMQVVPATMDHILSLSKGKERFVKQTSLLIGAFALANPSEEASKIRDEVALFQAIKNAFTRIENPQTKAAAEHLESALKQIVSEAITSKGIIDIFKTLDMNKPEISVLSEEFLASVQKIEYKNLAFEALKKLLEDEIKLRFRKNLIKSKKFSEMLDEALRKYKNRTIDSAQVIKELIDIARKVREDKSDGKNLNLTREEEAFYDALADNDSAKEILGDKTLAIIAKELTRLVKQNASVDWEIRESVQAKLKVMIKRLLREYGYPPDKQKIATELVLKQAEGFAEDWAGEIV
jgi:type I restriction enzyme R subunit